MTTPFPLLRLPRLAQIPVLQHMELIEVIAFSLVSKRTHNLSKYLRKKVSSRDIELEIGKNSVGIRIALTDGSPLTLYFYTDVLKTFEVFYRMRRFQWKNIGLSTKQWIERVFDVTKCPSLSRLILHGTPDCDVFSFLHVVPKISNLHISHNCTKTFAIEALQILSPVISEIILFELPFSNREEFQGFWMGNVERLTLYNDNLSRFQFNIDDLLASKAVKLELNEVPMSLRDLNLFFSRWLNKTSNHRLEHLSVKSPGHINEDVLLEGLNATRFTEQQARHFQSIRALFHPVFTRGFQMRTIDGKFAAITFCTFGTTYINFDVWS